MSVPKDHPGGSMHRRALTVQDYVDLLDSGEPWAQANYGDGEWACILGESGGNVNGEQYNPELRDLLRRTVIEPRDYMYGTRPGKARKHVANEWVAEHCTEPVDWVWKSTLPEANVRGELGPFLAALRRRSVFVVGPDHVMECDLPFGTRRGLGIPDGTAWQHWWMTTEDIIDTWRDGDVVTFSAGMASNVMIWELWPFARKRNITLIDVGAMWDPYCGVLSRSGYRKPTWPDAMAKNLRC